MIAYRYARVAAGEERTQANYVSPGVRDIRWLKPVRPGMTLSYTHEPNAKRDWASLPAFGLLEGYNEARDQDGTLVYSFVNRVLIARKPA
jgi:acyl dehydratase